MNEGTWSAVAIVLVVVAFVAGLIAADAKLTEDDVLNRFCIHQNPNLEYVYPTSDLSLTDNGTLTVKCGSNGEAAMKSATFEVSTDGEVEG